MKNKTLKVQAIVLLILYGLQFFAGMTLNLFVTIASNHPGSNAKNYFSGAGHGLVWALSGAGGWELAAHVYLALILVLASIGLFTSSLKYKSGNWMWSSAVATLFTIGALFNGLSFINYNHNVSSMIMASCWLIAVGAIVYGLVRDSNLRLNNKA